MMVMVGSSMLSAERKAAFSQSWSMEVDCLLDSIGRVYGLLATISGTDVFMFPYLLKHSRRSDSNGEYQAAAS